MIQRYLFKAHIPIVIRTEEGNKDSEQHSSVSIASSTLQVNVVITNALTTTNTLDPLQAPLSHIT